MRRFIYILIFFSLALFPLCGFAQQEKTEPQEVVPTLRKPSGEKMEKYRNSVRYVYDRKEKPKLNWRARLWDQVLRFLDKLFSNEGPFPFIRWSLAILLLLGLIFLILRIRMQSFLFVNKKINFTYDEETEDIETLDTDKLIEEALKNKNYRRATRLQYLKLLKTLQSNYWIIWKPDKTNRDYKYELKSSGYEGEFEQLTYVFDKVWYGDFKLKENQYSGIANAFEALSDKIRPNKNHEE